MKKLQGKNALITGSSRGIGQQIALGLADQGCNIIVHGRTKNSAAKTIQLLNEYPIKTFSVYGELSDKKQVDSLIKQVKDLNVSVDILYNNAAIMTDYHSNYWEHNWNEWIDTFKVNVIAMYDLCSAFIPLMIKNYYGRVINLTSGIQNTPELAPYGASKWAVDKLTDDIASKLENTAVRINTLDPGWLKTDMGGENAEHPVESVLPGALAPALIDNNGPNGKFFSAIENNFKDNRYCL